MRWERRLFTACSREQVRAVDELRVVGSRCGPMQPALELLAAGLDLSPLITATFPLAQASSEPKPEPKPKPKPVPNPNPKPDPKPSPNLTATFPPAQVDKAVALAGTKGTMKVQLRVSAD